MQIFARTIEIYKENWAFSDLLGRDYFKRALTYMNKQGNFTLRKINNYKSVWSARYFPFPRAKKKTEILKNSSII